ncbi:MAG: hypothetical protein SF052_18440 [Bacteroidia bacterium]|nr:hypothetical protein [Bacteroidia bacterium]
MKPIFSISSKLTAGVFSLVVSAFFLPGIYAQSCVAYEREMQEYFLSYESGDPIDMDYLERMKWRCDVPTPKMELVYYFFKSAEAFRSERLSDREAYDQATYYYDLCARNFSWLTKAGYEDSEFTERFFDKAEGLETALATLAYDLKYYPENRKYGEMDDNDLWAKKEITPNPRSESSRGMDDPATPEFDKRYVYQGKYVDEPAYELARPRIENGEPYGWVGTLDEIDPINYVKWEHARQEMVYERPFEGVARSASEGIYSDYSYIPEQSTYREAAPAPAPTATPYYLNDEWVEALENQGTQMYVYVSSRDLCPVYAEPGAFSRQVAFLSFGETVVQIKGENTKPVQRDGFNYMPVITSKNQRGWVELSTIVRDGRLATFTSATRGFVNINPNTSEAERTSDRNAILFQAGELVILTGINKTNVKVLSQSRDKEGWLSATTTLSIDPLDVHVAFRMQEAMKMPAARDQQEALVRLSREYPDSALTPAIITKIQDLQKVTGFSPFR